MSLIQAIYSVLSSRTLLANPKGNSQNNAVSLLFLTFNSWNSKTRQISMAGLINESTSPGRWRGVCVCNCDCDDSSTGEGESSALSMGFKLHNKPNRHNNTALYKEISMAFANVEKMRVFRIGRGFAVRNWCEGLNVGSTSHTALGLISSQCHRQL